jgi:RNA polymerase sigma-70 factor (ECF subfamily)
VYEKIGTFNRSSSFYTWLYRVAVNTSLNYKQKGFKKNEMLSDNDYVLDRAQKPPGDLQALDMDLRSALEKLPDRQRATFMLKVYDDLKFSDIARVMKCSVGGAKANYFHAVRKLQHLMEDYRAV